VIVHGIAIYLFLRKIETSDVEYIEGPFQSSWNIGVSRTCPS